MERTSPEPKRRKIKQPPFRRTVSSPSAEKSRDSKSLPAVQTSKTNFMIQQAKNFAVAQAQQEGCTANFRISDSPFGNFLVPVIPTRKELAG